MLDPAVRFEDDLVARVVVALCPEGAPPGLIGEVMGVTSTRVLQIEAKALRKLRKAGFGLEGVTRAGARGTGRAP